MENYPAALNPVHETLTQSEGVIADAARLLSLQRTTLIEKMRKYEMRAA